MEDIYSDWAGLALESGRSQRLWERRGGRRRSARERAEQRKTDRARLPPQQTGQLDRAASSADRAASSADRAASSVDRSVRQGSLLSRQVS
jgi:hypothetical protein